MVNMKKSDQAFRAEGVMRSSQQIPGKVLVYFLKVTLLATPLLEWKLPLSLVRTPDKVGNEMSSLQLSLLITFTFSTLPSGLSQWIPSLLIWLFQKLHSKAGCHYHRAS